MKLQLDSATTAVYTAKLAPSTSLLEDARRVLDLFAAEGHDPYTRRDMNAVLNGLGYTLPTDGDVWYALSAVIEAVSSRSGKRGYWTQGTRVGSVSITPAATRAVDAIAEAAANGAEVEVKVKPGLSWKPTTPLAVATTEGYYSEDPGLRRLAVAESACFGAYKAADKACGACPLARFCANAALSALSEIANRLDDETSAELVRVAEAANAPAPAPAAPPVSTPIPAAAEAARATTAPATGTDAHLDSKYGVDNWEAVPMPFDGVCSGCDQAVLENVTAIHVNGGGMYHRDCA